MVHVRKLNVEGMWCVPVSQLRITMVIRSSENKNTNQQVVRSCRS